MLTIDNLIEKVLTYNPTANIEIIRKAYVFSREAHCSQVRIDQTPYIYHPLAVADILADMKLDTASIAAGLLHDTIEDTGMSANEIREMFGTEIAFLVESLTKLSKIEFKTKEDAQAENFRKMLLAMAKDVRVILIKFADRLHNMRTLTPLREEKQIRIASETLDIYAPLANRLGIGWLKAELEDLCFKTIMPELFQELEIKITKRKEEQKKYIDEVVSLVSGKLAEAGIPCKIKGRAKHFYSIYQKMVKQKIPVEQVQDVIGIRVITDTQSHCYDILGIVHSLWHLVPGRFKDFISLPKSNMYQSLHTTVAGPGGERVEFQIRTTEMNELAEEGIAAHWRYKEKGGFDKKNDRYIAWLRELLKELSDTKELIDGVKEAMLPETIFVYTPKRDIKELPVGATPIDFAYSVHSEVGNRCVGAKINGRIVPLRYKLNTADSIEILTSPHHAPTKDWLAFVVTHRAKNRIRQWIKAEERKQGFELGTKLLDDAMRRHNLPLSLLKSEKMNIVLKSLSLPSIEEMYILVGYGKISAHQIVNRLAPEKAGQEKTIEDVITKPARQQQDKKNVISIKGIDNVLYHIGKCCYPVPGDIIVGFITKGKGVTIHRRECPNLEKLSADKERLLKVEWTRDDATSPARLLVECIDKPGIIANLSSAISAANINIASLKANSTHDSMAVIELTLAIHDKKQLNGIINKIAQMDGIYHVRR
ncbi:MAG: bifunctional (p)ppGpp synthetase/guanosine-3',5'-bis(diphosphate) 3'-pyrophosphohydrolase [Nitrospirae bacterium]|nr:bifunctional (p)ppGpp synthetase/guanosine-3',5'-bis(diphosphate) 3'-pyrophosphohydrolase [Nitrospirota bacterium]